MGKSIGTGITRTPVGGYLIRKHMDERRRRETDMKQSTTSHSESDASSTSGENSPESGEKCKAKNLDDYYNKGKIIIAGVPGEKP